MAEYAIATQGPSTLTGAVGHAVQIATASLGRSSTTTYRRYRYAGVISTATALESIPAGAIRLGAVTS